MGKTTRWLKGVLGMKKDKDKDLKEKKRWGFAKSGNDANPVSQIPLSNNIAGNIPAAATDAAAWLRCYISETDHQEAQNKHAIAVAAATVAAADAAMAAAHAAVAVVRLTSNGRRGRERWAAGKIQTVFRGYLARKALRALKGLVRLQALVRGYLVRKRAAATLHSMQALIRAQVKVRSHRIRRSFNKENIRPRESIEKFEDPRSEINAYDDCPKIVEIDTFKTRSRSRRNVYIPFSECEDDLPYYQTVFSSPLPCPVPARASIPYCQNLDDDLEWYFTGDECRCSTTAHSTPRLANMARSIAPTTPAKSVCGDGYFRPNYSNSPNYMANTQSFQAKLRSLSVPKQRPDQPAVGAKKRLSLNEVMAARNSMSGVRMNKSFNYQVQEALEL